MDEPIEPRPPPVSKLSKTPSWIMLGFILGALFIWSLQRSPETPPAAAIIEPEKPAAPIGPLPAPRLSDIEAVFAMWGAGAIWENDVTEVALWTPETKRFGDYFEVIRSGDNLYFRSIPRLTRRILDHGVKTNSPLALTETETHYQEWLRDVKDVRWRAITTSGYADDHPPLPVATPPPRTDPGSTVTHSPVRTIRSGPTAPDIPPKSLYQVVPPVVPLPEPAPASPPPRTGTGDGKP
jgi:hypothetical protein